MENKDIAEFIAQIADPSSILAGRNPSHSLDETKRKLKAGESVRVYDIGTFNEGDFLKSKGIIKVEESENVVRNKKRKYV